MGESGLEPLVGRGLRAGRRSVRAFIGNIALAFDFFWLTVLLLEDFVGGMMYKT